MAPDPGAARRGPGAHRGHAGRVAPPVRRSGRPSAHGRRLRLVRALAVAVIAVLLLAGLATALGYRLPGLDILFVDELPPAGTGLDLGSPVPLAEARAGEPPRVLVPAALPEPETAYVLGDGRPPDRDAGLAGRGG